MFSQVLLEKEPVKQMNSDCELNNSICNFLAQLAGELNCPTQSESAILECLRKVPAQDLVLADLKLDPASNLAFVPIVDEDFPVDTEKATEL